MNPLSNIRQTSVMKKTIFSGMRPTGKLHLGHLVGALQNWTQLQDEYQCVYCIVDWHAFMGEYENSGPIRGYIFDMAVDWMACGIDPERSIVYVQSQVPEHVELHMIFSCLTPLGWLERNPTYKEQLREITARDLQTYGFLGYPVLQAADILLYKADAVPIGEDQLPHVELTREIARRFNFLYKKDVFADCAAILTETPRLLGIDGRKMSKSYFNAINLSDSAAEVKEKVRQMITDPQRIRKSDPGRPEQCNVYSYYKVFAPELTQDVSAWCTQALKGCTECKANLSDCLLKRLAPIQEKRAELLRDKERIPALLQEGQRKAQAIARRTLQDVKEVIFPS
ncbi:MAG TPA: tryptophan--tRNA ligase [Candidatus Omnitrophota bacterium]|nr:tryptophan--tRNA ligase [Candidatus Omnitrophota bacterium]